MVVGLAQGKCNGSASAARCHALQIPSFGTRAVGGILDMTTEVLMRNLKTNCSFDVDAKTKTTARPRYEQRHMTCAMKKYHHPGSDAIQDG